MNKKPVFRLSNRFEPVFRSVFVWPRIQTGFESIFRFGPGFETVCKNLDRFENRSEPDFEANPNRIWTSFLDFGRDLPYGPIKGTPFPPPRPKPRTYSRYTLMMSSVLNFFLVGGLRHLGLGFSYFFFIWWLRKFFSLFREFFFFSFWDSHFSIF